MELKRALELIGIKEILKQKRKEGTDYAIKGLFECCNELNEAIKTIERYCDEVG